MHGVLINAIRGGVGIFFHAYSNCPSLSLSIRNGELHHGWKKREKDTRVPMDFDRKYETDVT